MKPTSETSILIVDDDAVQLKLLGSILRQAGYKVTSASDGHTAINTVAGQNFDLIVSDVNMPAGVTGFTVLATVRANPALAFTPIIFLTARRDKGDIMKALEAGVDDYVVKPVDDKILLAKIESILKHYSDDKNARSADVSEEAKVEFTFRLNSIYDSGVSFHAPIELTPGFQFTLSSAILSNIGISNTKLRVMHCQPDATGKVFQTRANFLGLTPQEEEKLRQWVVSSRRKSRRAA